tara:strand:- start:3913 stop:4068 length:156 start_codon:yes stop_codon:yes gene_type:complete
VVSCYREEPAKFLEVVMPKVGNKHFSYTEKGRKAAKKYAKKTGKKMTRKKK